MHDGCSGSFENELDVLQKVRMMGFNNQPIPVPILFKCHECDNDVRMTTYEYKCSNCGLIFAVTPCNSFDINSIVAIGKNL